MKPLHRLCIGGIVLGFLAFAAARSRGPRAHAGTPETQHAAQYARALAIFLDDEIVGGTPEDVARLASKNDALISQGQGWERALAAVLTTDERETALRLGRKRAPSAGHGATTGPDAPSAEAVELARTLQSRFGYARLPVVSPPAFDHWGGVPTRDRFRAVLALLDQTTVDRWRGRQLLAITLGLLETERQLAETRREVRRLLPSLVSAPAP